MSYEALHALASYPIFLLFRVEPRAKGKTDKIPVSPLTGRDIDATDETQWLTLDKALEASQKFRLGIALAINPKYKLFCVDIDACLVDGAWNDTALAVLQWFPGALVEVSHSGTGLHIFGSYQGEIPPHMTRREGIPFELYTRLRFIALTGTSMAGDPLIDCTVALSHLITTYLPQTAAALAAETAEWTTEPVEGYDGPEDDDELLKLAIGQTTMKQALGNALKFVDLWEGNATELGHYYHTTTDGEAYNASSADMALASHLHYFTGGNCERVERLMRRSALVREKWDRDDYIRGTILKTQDKAKYYRTRDSATPPSVSTAVAPQDEEPRPVPQVHVANLEDDGVIAEIPQPPPGEHGAFLFVDQQLKLFKDCMYVEDINMVITSDGVLLNQSQFNARFAGYKFPTEPDGSKPTTKAWDAFVLSQLQPFPKVRGIHFAPRLPPHSILHEEGHAYVNSWNPIKIKRRKGDIQVFLTHLKKKHPIESDQEILLAYMAFLVQHIGTKAQWAPLLQGVEGDGKTFFSRAMEYCLGKRYTHWPKAAEIDSKFNDAFYGKLLICVEDVKINEGKESMWETLKPMITNDRIEIEGKGIAKVTREVCFNFLLNSNHQDGVRKTANDRRIAPFFGAHQFPEDLLRDGMDAKYFIDLYKWAKDHGGYAHIAHFLQHYKIPDELNPAIGSIRAPVTSSTKDAIYAGSGIVEQEVQEAITAEVHGFCGGWISLFAFNALVDRVGRGHALSQQKRVYILRQLGYMIPEALAPSGLVDSLPVEGRTKIFAHKNNPAAYYPDREAVKNAYVAAQQARMKLTGT